MIHTSPKFVRVVGALLGLFLLLTSGVSPLQPETAAARAAGPIPSALVRITIASPADLEFIKNSGIAVYSRLASDTGHEYLLVVANPSQQELLARQDLALRVLDADSAGAEYYVLTAFRAGAIDQVRLGMPILDAEGRWAVVRATPDQAEQLPGLGVELQRIGLHPIALEAQQPTSIPEVINPDPIIAEMIDQVNAPNVLQYDRELAGEVPVWVDGGWYTIPSRFTYSGVPIQKTMHYVGQHMTNLGLNVEYHQWDSPTDPNVIGELPGLTQPNNIFIIGAHIDDVQGTPGADDNASGSVGALIAADIMAQYQWGCTLRFAFWTGEEEGLLGSDAYAVRAHQRGENIVGYLNLDMIAYNTKNSTPGIDLIYNPNMPLTRDLAYLFADVVTAYNLNLIPGLQSSLGGGSDHQSFWDQGYTAILAIEDQADFNPQYHGPGDTVANNDLGYFTNFVKASVGTFAHMSGCMIPPSGSLAGTVSNVGGEPVSPATVKAYYSPTQSWVTTTAENGSYQLGLIPGVYTVTTTSPGYMQSVINGIQITENQTTTLNITLEVTPTYTITGFVTDALSGEPISGTVTVVGTQIPPVHTDPATGAYAVSMFPGKYTLRAEAGYYLPKTQNVTLIGNLQQDLAMQPICLLVVDDDGGASYNTYFTSSLDRLGYLYNRVTGPPTLADLAHYQGAIWLTGDQSTDTLTASDQANLGAYLDGGGRLFISGQNIGQDISDSVFYTKYLHASLVADSAYSFVLSGLDFLRPLVDIFIQGVGGANNQTSPDEINPVQGGVPVYDYAGAARYGGVAYSGLGREVYFSFGFEAINRSLDRDNVMEATLNYLDVCGVPAPPQASFTFEVAPTNAVTFTNTSQGTAWMSYVWDFGDGSALSSETNPVHIYVQPGLYTVTLTATSRYGQDSSTVQVEVGEELFAIYLPVIEKNVP